MATTTKYVRCQVRCPDCKKDRVDLIDLTAPANALPPSAGKERFSVLCWPCMTARPGKKTEYELECIRRMQAYEDKIRDSCPLMTKAQILALRNPNDKALNPPKESRRAAPAPGDGAD